MLKSEELKINWKIYFLQLPRKPFDEMFEILVKSLS